MRSAAIVPFLRRPMTVLTYHQLFKRCQNFNTFLAAQGNGNSLEDESGNELSAEDNVKGAERSKGFEEIELAKTDQGTQLVFDATLRAHGLKIAGDSVWGQSTGYFYLVKATITRLSQRRSGDVCPQDGATIGPKIAGQFLERHRDTIDFLAC